MQESDFHRLADHWLTTAADVLEEADANGLLEVEHQNGALTLTLPSKKILLVSKHTPTHQLWFASPVSGGLHFVYGDAQWKLQDGRTLEQQLSEELQSLANIRVTW